MITHPTVEHNLGSTSSWHKQIKARQPIRAESNLHTEQKVNFAAMEELSDSEEEFIEPYPTNQRSIPSHDQKYSEVTDPKRKLDKYNNSNEKVDVPNKCSSDSKSNSKYYWYTLICIVSIIVAYTNFVPYSQNSENIEPATRLKNHIKGIHEEFPTQNPDTMFALLAGIKRVIADIPNEPSVFLLLHNDGDRTPACLARKVGRAAMEFFNLSSQEPVELHGFELKHNKTLLEDYGTLIDIYEPIVRERHIMIVHDLHKIPALIAQAFHVFCDTENPLVNQAVIVFTMENSETLLEGNPTRQAESVLQQLWGSSLEKDILDPLMIRITNDVLFVHREKNLPC